MGTGTTYCAASPSSALTIMSDSSTVMYGFLIFAVIYLIRYTLKEENCKVRGPRYVTRQSVCLRGSFLGQLSKIPTVGGPSAPILSWYGAFQMIFQGPAILQKAYIKARIMLRTRQWFIGRADLQICTAQRHNVQVRPNEKLEHYHFRPPSHRRAHMGS